MDFCCRSSNITGLGLMKLAQKLNLAFCSVLQFAKKKNSSLLVEKQPGIQTLFSSLWFSDIHKKCHIKEIMQSSLLCYIWFYIRNIWLPSSRQFKAYIKSYIADGSNIFSIEHISKTGHWLRVVYVMVDFICKGYKELSGTRIDQELQNEKFLPTRHNRSFPNCIKLMSTNWFIS